MAMLVAVSEYGTQQTGSLTVSPTVFYNRKHRGIFKRIFKQQNHQVSAFLVIKQRFYSNKLENMFNSGSTVPLVHNVQRTPWESSGRLEGQEVTNPLISLV